MKQHEKDTQLAALRKQIEELEAMPVELDQPLCVMPGRLGYGEKYWIIDNESDAVVSVEEKHRIDTNRFKRGLYFSSERQASADAHAVSVMRLMRRQPGVVAGDDVEKWRPRYKCGHISVEFLPFEVADSYCMFPCYATEEQARAAIKAVGGEDALRRCAEYWSGVMK